jgi:hypothetical protein
MDGGAAVSKDAPPEDASIPKEDRREAEVRSLRLPAMPVVSGRSGLPAGRGTRPVEPFVEDGAGMRFHTPVFCTGGPLDSRFLFYMQAVQCVAQLVLHVSIDPHGQV